MTNSAASLATSPTSNQLNPKLEITEQADESKLMIESTVRPLLEQHEIVAGLVWQFQGIYELLLDNLMSENWEIRHGAALGLRELVKNMLMESAGLRGIPERRTT